MNDLKRLMNWMVMMGFLVGLVWGCSQADDGPHVDHSSAVKPVSDGSGAPSDESSTVLVPEEYREGEERFNTFCARCHGKHGRGTDKGPPLVHKIYEPSHHADGAFFRAAAQGVRAHHWEFGNMPAIKDATPDDVRLIVQYVRWLQREAGIH